MALTVEIDVKMSENLRNMQPLPMGRVRHVGGRGLVNVLREHFSRLDRERPNQLGGKRTHFWRQVAHSVQQPRTAGDKVIVSINHVGAAQRLFGGSIVPVNAKYLTIPARAEAHGKRAREFPDLEILWGKRGRPVALVQRQQTSVNYGRDKNKGVPKSGGERGGGVFFWLVQEVTQRADPTVLPTDDELGNAAVAAMREFVDAFLQNPKQ